MLQNTQTTQGPTALTAQPPSNDVQNTTEKPQSTWEKDFPPDSWPNWGLVLVGIIAGVVAIWTLLAIKRQADLQQIAMRQWVTTYLWMQEPRYVDGQLVELTIRIPVLNETSYPLTLDSVVAEFNGVEQIKLVRSEIAPKDGHMLAFPVRLESAQISEYQHNRFILVVECRVTFVDVFKNEQTTMFNRLYRCGPSEFEQKDKYTQNSKKT